MRKNSLSRLNLGLVTLAWGSQETYDKAVVDTLWAFPDTEDKYWLIGKKRGYLIFKKSKVNKFAERGFSKREKKLAQKRLEEG